MVSRAERSAVANWWWTIDRWMLAAVASLIVLGLVLTMAGSPPVAERLGLSTFHSCIVRLCSDAGDRRAPRHVLLTPRQVRRVALSFFFCRWP